MTKRPHITLSLAAMTLAASIASAQQPDPKPAAKPDEKPAAQPASPKPVVAPPTLDDLLGTKPIKPEAPEADPNKPEQAKVTPADPNTAPDQNKTDLDRLLTVAELGDAFKQAVTLMGDASTRLYDHKDPGLDTQRVQEDVIKRLDQLISSMEKQKSESKPKPDPNKDPSGKQQPPKQRPQNQQGQQQASQPKDGDGSKDHLGPTLQNGQLKPELESARAAWGSLPQRVRDMLMQGTEDRFSARYKALTQEYYKRLAEENSK